MPELIDYNYQYINGFKRLGEFEEGLPAPQRAYWAWQEEVCRRVFPVSWRYLIVLPKMPRLRQRVRNIIKPKVKECYRNAISAALELQCDYVEGYVYSHVTLHHAWNAIGDDHFDLTLEERGALSEIKNGSVQYTQIIRLTHDEIPEYLEHRRQDMVPWMGLYFMNYVYKERKEDVCHGRII